MPPAATLRARLADPETFATTLLVIFLDTYGPEALRWAPETIRMELEDDYNVRLPEGNFHKLMAAIYLLQRPEDFFRRPSIFVRLCNLFAGSGPSLTVFNPADAAECAWGLTEALLLVPPDDEDPEPFSEPVRRYIGAVVDAAGLREAPDLLRLGLREAPDLLRLGIRDTPSGQADYSGLATDDPATFAVEYQLHEDRAAAITAMLQENLDELFQELEALPLRRGSTHDLLKRLRGRVR